jgi:hypothetical protein
LAFPILAGGERKGRRIVALLKRVRLIARSSGHPPYILEVSTSGPLDLTCLKSLSTDVSAWTSCRATDFLLFSKGSHTLWRTLAWGFLNGMLIVNANTTIKTSELLWPVQNPNCTKISLAGTNLLLVVSVHIRPWSCSQLINLRRINQQD